MTPESNTVRVFMTAGIILAAIASVAAHFAGVIDLPFLGR